jgi:acylglycerol lipase
VSPVETTPGPLYTEGRTGEAGLFWRSWLPPRPKAVLVFVHGLAEHSGRYREAALRFASRGFAALAFDHRGHGRGPGPRAHVSSFDELRADVRTAILRVRETQPALPLFLVGHSQGGLVSLTFALREPQGLAGLVLSAPFLGVPERLRPSRPLAATARLLARVWPTARFANGVDPAFVSRDPEVVAAYRADPAIGATVSASWYRAMLAALAEAHAEAARLQPPTLLMYAGADALVDPAATERWLERAPSGRVEAVRFDGLYHEIFNEPEKEKVFARMEAWLERRMDLSTNSRDLA